MGCVIVLLQRLDEEILTIIFCGVWLFDTVFRVNSFHANLPSLRFKASTGNCYCIIRCI